MDKKRLCSGCGKPKPYRRAFRCRTCWDSMSAAQQLAVLQIGRRNGRGTLRAGQEVKAAK